MDQLGVVVGQLQQQVQHLAAQNQQMASELGRLSVQENVTEDWLQLPFRFVSLAAGATSQVTRTISGDGPFDLIEITYTAIDTVTNLAVNQFRLRIREGEAVGRSLTIDNQFVDADNSAGSATRPYIIRGRRRYRANVGIVVEVTSTAPTNAITLEVTLHGIKVWTR